jgi:hypothetical protein
MPKKIKKRRKSQQSTSQKNVLHLKNFRIKSKRGLKRENKRERSCGLNAESNSI